jgi:hypothetical protein
MAVSSISFVQGSDVSVTVQLIDKDTGLPLSLQGFQSASAFFQKQDLTETAVSGALVSADLGQVSFSLNNALTLTLNPGDDLDWEVEVIKNDQNVIAQVLGKLSIAKRLFT